MPSSEFYATVDNVKIKLRIPLSDKSIDEELQLYAQEIDAMIETEVRKRVGYTNEDGDPIDINFTITTNPAIDTDIRSRADDLLEGKFRFKTNNDDQLWLDATKKFEEYLTAAFGWASGASLKTNPSFTVSPEMAKPGIIIDVTGGGWAQYEEIIISVGNSLAETRPIPARANSDGDLKTIVFFMPQLDPGTHEIKILGKNIPRGRTLKTRNVAYGKMVVN